MSVNACLPYFINLMGAYRWWGFRMSLLILRFAKSFLNERLSAAEFVPAYMELWRLERGGGEILQDEFKLSECLSSIFCLADLYNPEADKENYEFDELELRCKVADLVRKLGY